MVVRTDGLTHVAPVQPLPHQRLELLRDLPAVLDREVADAPAGIEHPRRHERLRGTRIQAPRAAPAPVRLERCIHRQRHIHHQRSEKEERPLLRIDQHGILPEPPQPRAPREIPLQQRPAVHVRTRVHHHAKLRLQPRHEAAQPLTHDLVVVITARIPRHGAARLAAAVVHPHHDRVRCARVRPTRIASQLRAARHVVHARMVSRVQPRVEVRHGVGHAQIRHPHQVEAQPVRLPLEARAEPLAHRRGRRRRVARCARAHGVRAVAPSIARRRSRR